MINPTHIATIEQFTETGDMIDDGAGGQIPERDWVTVVDGMCRYEPEGQPFQREEMGGRVYKEARTHWAPWTVGEMVAADDGESEREVYRLNVGAGDNWRINIEGVDGVFAIREQPKPHSSSYSAPQHVTIEVERVDPANLGGESA